MNPFETPKKYSEAEAEKILADAFDPVKVQVYCAEHAYFGPLKNRLGGMNKVVQPHSGCARCWFVWLFHDLASTPASQRQARLDEMEEVIHHVVEAVERDEFDFKIANRPEISIEKDAA
jgi:hypothetical protein